ncbi:MAG: hypothetical protein U0984_09545 [Prosthecobacter sp.]|nr:hypothetical protein [Prosthecobacter sp.]
MKLGAPLSDTALRVMLLGSGELGKEVAIELQRLGVEVIAVDRYPNAPAMRAELDLRTSTPQKLALFAIFCRALVMQLLKQLMQVLRSLADRDHCVFTPADLAPFASLPLCGKQYKCDSVTANRHRHACAGNGFRLPARIGCAARVGCIYL